MSPDENLSLDPDERLNEPPFLFKLFPPVRAIFPPGKYPEPASIEIEPPKPSDDEPDFALIVPPVDLTELPCVSPVCNSMCPESPLTLDPV